MKPYYLHGISIGGYRAFIGSGNNVFGPLGKINLLVGRNNSGKSNFLRFIYKHLNYVLNSNDQSRSEDRESRFTELDVPHVGQQELTVEIALSLNSPQFTDLKKRLGERPNGPKLLVLLEKLMSTSGFSRRDSAIWFAYKAPRQNDRLELTAAIPETVKKALTQEEWLQLWTALTNQSGGDFNVHWVPETLKALSRIHSTKYAVHFIPAIRFIGSPENVNFDFSGNGIIAELGRLQNPTIKERELRKNFDKINEFLREVTN